MNPEPRTPSQNNCIHPIFREVSSLLAMSGREITIKLSVTPESVKELFVQHYLHGKRTSQTSKEELAKALDLFLESMNVYLAESGLGPIEIKEP